MSTKLDSPSYHFRYCSTLYSYRREPSTGTFRVMRRNYQHDFPVNSLAAAAAARVVFKRRACRPRLALEVRSADGEGVASASGPSHFPQLHRGQPSPTSCCMRPRSRSIEPRKRMLKTSNVDNYCQTFSSKYLGFHLAINVLSTHFSVLPDVGESWRLYELLERRSCTDQFQATL